MQSLALSYAKLKPAPYQVLDLNTYAHKQATSNKAELKNVRQVLNATVILVYTWHLFMMQKKTDIAMSIPSSDVAELK